MSDLGDMVNAELVEELGGPHLQLGPSHFMRKDLDEEALERIWSYNIYPFIEDQLFGEPERIARYTFGDVLKRFRSKVTPGTSLAEPDEELDASETDRDGESGPETQS